MIILEKFLPYFPKLWLLKNTPPAFPLDTLYPGGGAAAAVTPKLGGGWPRDTGGRPTGAGPDRPRAALSWRSRPCTARICAHTLPVVWSGSSGRR